MCIIIAGVSGCILLGFVVGTAAAIVLICALGDFLFPIYYTITPEYAQIKSLVKRKKIAWGDVAGCAYSDSALLLSTVSYSSPLFAFRTITLHFGCNRDRILELVKVFRSAAQ